MKNLEVRKLTPEQTLRVPESLSFAVTFTALDTWSRLVEQTYSHNIYRFEAIEDDKVTGILVLTEVRHPVFGHYLATAPFGSYGGFAYSSLSARDGLLDAASALAQAQGAEHVNVRFEARESESPLEEWLQHPIYFTYRVDLSSDLDQLLRSFGPDHRNHIRKSLKKGFSIRFGHLDLLDAAYEGLARSMHELGSPYHNKEHLRRMAEYLGDDLKFVVVNDSRGELAGAGVFISQGNVVTNLHANILRKFRSDYAGEFLYWSIIEHYATGNYQLLDLGRSLTGSGNEIFKMKWQPRRVPLAYWYYLPKGGPVPELNQKSPKFQLAIWAWKRLPAFVVRALGPKMIRGIV